MFDTLISGRVVASSNSLLVALVSASFIMAMAPFLHLGIQFYKFLWWGIFNFIVLQVATTT